MFLKPGINRRIIFKALYLIFVLFTAVAAFRLVGWTFDVFNSGLKKNAAYEEIEDKKVRLRFMNWDSSDRVTRDKLEKAVKQFMEKNPHIEVISISVPFSEYREQLIRQTSDGNDPDIIQLTSYWPILLGNKGVLEQLDSYCGRDKILDFYSREALESCKYKGSLYSIPFSLNPFGLWYNKNLLRKAGIDKPPESIEELDVQLDIIRRRLPDKFGIGLDMTRTEHALISNWPFFFSFGAANLLVDDKNPGFSSKEAVKAMEWFRKIVNGKFTPEGVKTDILREKIANDEIIFKVDGPNLRGVIQSKSRSADYKGNLFDRAFGVVPVPASAGFKGITVNNTYSLGISRRSAYKKEAWELIKFIIKGESSVKNYIIPSGYIPSLRNVLDNNAIELNNPSTHMFLDDIIPSSRSINYTPRFSEASVVIMDGIHRIFSGADIPSTCSEIDMTLKQLFSE